MVKMAMTADNNCHSLMLLSKAILHIVMWQLKVAASSGKDKHFIAQV